MQNFKKLTLFFNDVILLYASLALMVLLRYPDGFTLQFNIHAGPFSLLFVIWLLIFYLADLYRLKTPRTSAQLAKTLTRIILVCGVTSIVALYLFSPFFALTPKTNLVLVGIFFLVLTYLTRTGLERFMRTGTYAIAFLGDSPLITETVAFLEKNPQTGYRVELWIKDASAIVMDHVPERMREKEVRLVVVAPSLLEDIPTVNSIYSLLPFEMDVVDFSDFYEQVFEKVPLAELSVNWFLEHVSTRRPFYGLAKRTADVIFSFMLGVILLPLGVLLGILIRLTSRGPAIFTQKRTGKSNKRFTVVKFRTMRVGADGPLWTEEHDTRITGFGKFLRATHLDEIPQLWNIFKGDISFTGPRPERIELSEQYAKFPYYEMRHVVQPGLTGWAQINYRPSASLEEAYEKLCYDIYYVKNRSLFLDFLIFLRTVKHVFVPKR